MAYLTCNESFQGLKERLKRFRGRAANSSLLQKLKASLKDPKVRKGLGLGAGYLALSRYQYHKDKDRFHKNHSQAEGWIKDTVVPGRYVKHIEEKRDANGNILQKADIKYGVEPTWDITSPIMGLVGNKLGVPSPKHESAILVPGTFVYNEGIIDTVKDKVSGAVDSVGNTINSFKERVKTNVGNLANGINYGINSAKNVASGIANGISGAQEKIANFASNVVGSKNVKPVNNKPGFKVKPVQHY